MSSPIFQGFWMDKVARSAFFSNCRKHRLWLSRSYLLNSPEQHPVMLFVMRNPSTADADKDDPTIRRCMGFAAREGCATLMVMNLYTYKSTDPKKLMRADVRKNHELADVVMEAGLGLEKLGVLVCAWGGMPIRDGRDDEVLRMAKAAGVQPKCLGVTAKGLPRHPLYLKKDAPLIDYSKAPASLA